MLLIVTIKKTTENWLLDIIGDTYEKSFCNMMETKVWLEWIQERMERKRVEIWIIRHLFQGFLLKRELEKYDSIQRKKQFKNGFSAFFFSDGRNKSMFTCYRNDLKKNWTKFIESSNLRMRRKYRDHFLHNSFVL